MIPNKTEKKKKGKRVLYCLLTPLNKFQLQSYLIFSLVSRDTSLKIICVKL